MWLAAAFDLDGVLVDTEALKASAWLLAVQQVADPPRAVLGDLDTYNRSRRGVPRREKFEHVAACLGEPPERVEGLLAAYADLLSAGLARAEALPGAREFVRRWRGARSIVSSAPTEEIHSHLGRLGFPRFDAIYSSTTAKEAALRDFESRHGNTVFFGDAVADAQAASRIGCAFVAIGPNRMSFDTNAVASADNLASLLHRVSELGRAR